MRISFRFFISAAAINSRQALLYTRRSCLSTMRLSLSLFALMATLWRLDGVEAFAVQRPTVFGVAAPRTRPCLGSSNEPDDEAERQQKLANLGFSSDEIKKNPNEQRQPERKVRVDIRDIDPITLTALGFGAIAFNFLVLGNLGDGGIGGVVATIINTLNQ
jgi:hypothetical protein